MGTIFFKNSYFDQEELQGISAELEKAVLCQHWFALLEDNTRPEVTATKDLVFREMWRHRIAAKVCTHQDLCRIS